MNDFVHLHIHSEFSLLDGANRIKDLPVRAKELGMNAMALTDHGVMYGAIDFYKACKKEGIKPIIGCEVYVAPRTRFDKEAGIDNKYNHLILLVKNMQGYKNLIKLVSLSFIDGYYYKPRIDLDILKQYHEGLICLSACLAGSVSQAILRNDIEKAENIAKWFKDVFGDDYYLELQCNGVKEQIMVNQKLIQIGRKLNIPLVGTNDAHYLKREDAYNHEVLLCIQTGKKMTDTDRMRFNTDELYVKSPEEMKEFFKNIPEAIENTVKIAEKCNIEFEFGHTILPNYDVPKEFKTHYDFFKKLCDDGMKKRYGENPSKEALDRLEYEVSVISKMGYVDYYLIVWDYINYAKSVGIPVGPGRGSGAGSIAAYAIGITDIDPLKYNLLFERFLNPERISMPDFDVDFCAERRQEVIDYVCKKYGRDHVSQIITFGTMSARQVIRDVGRALDVPLIQVDKIAKMIPTGPHVTIKQGLDANIELKTLYENDDEIKNLINIAMSLEGLPRQAGTHACGVVITKDPVVTYVPLYVNQKDGAVSTQYIMTTLEELGLLKMDFLGLRTLTVIDDAKKLIKENRNIDVKYDEEMKDPKVYNLWAEGNTFGIFQFESKGITEFMKELKPTCLEDIIAGVSLYRPGPMDQIPRYLKNRANPEKAEYTHSSLKPILAVTHGCMVYQEQVMQIVRELAGYSLGRADLVRRAMGKKKLDVMAKERQYFIYGQTDENGNIIIPGCIRNGIDEVSANKIFDEMAEFAKYAFNKSHAAAYAVLSYYTAYLKAWYPEELLAATLNSYLGNLEKVPIYIAECKRLGIEVLKPDINESYIKFTVHDGKIRFGLGSIKNVGTQVVETIVKEREKNGLYKDFTDFCERIQDESINKKCIESLIRAGAFDNFKKTRATLIASYESIIDSIQGMAKKNLRGQVTFFDLEEDKEDKLEDFKYNYNELEEYSERELLDMEKEMLGLYISGHPLNKYINIIKDITNINTINMREIDEDIKEGLEDEDFSDGQYVKYAGIISKVQKKYTKNNELMAFLTVEDLYGSAEIIVFPKIYMQESELIQEDNIVIIEGRLSIREDEDCKILASKIRLLDDKINEKSTNFNIDSKYDNKSITINITNMDEAKKQRLRKAIRYYASKKSNIKINVLDDGQLKPCGKIFFNDNVLLQFKEVFGEERIKLE